jgi:hypothetical protein
MKYKGTSDCLEINTEVQTPIAQGLRATYGIKGFERKY